MTSKLSSFCISKEQLKSISKIIIISSMVEALVNQIQELRYYPKAVEVTYSELGLYNAKYNITYYLADRGDHIYLKETKLSKNRFRKDIHNDFYIYLNGEIVKF